MTIVQDELLYGRCNYGSNLVRRSF